MKIEEYKIIDKFMTAQIYMRNNNPNWILMQFNDAEINLINHILYKYKQLKEAIEELSDEPQ